VRVFGRVTVVGSRRRAGRQADRRQGEWDGSWVRRGTGTMRRVRLLEPCREQKQQRRTGTAVSHHHCLEMRTRCGGEKTEIDLPVCPCGAAEGQRQCQRTRGVSTSTMLARLHRGAWGITLRNSASCCWRASGRRTTLRSHCYLALSCACVCWKPDLPAWSEHRVRIRATRKQ
jgi:hypothetical protein